MLKTMIEIKNLNKSYQSKNDLVKALIDVNLSVQEGEIYGVIGLSGAGKTTLLRIITTLEKPDSGEIILNDYNIKALSDRHKRLLKKQMGIVFQGYNLLEQQNVFNNIAFPLVIDGVNKQTIKAKVEALLDLVGLSTLGNRYLSQLSGGQKQRVAIARALANDPKILLLDEITSALDPLMTLQIINLLKKINKEYNVTILLITHDMSVVKSLCQKVAIIADGQIVENGPVQEVFSNPRSVIGKKFMEVGE